MNDALAVGVIQALEAQGLKPGKNVMVVSATCHGDVEQPPEREGVCDRNSAHQLRRPVDHQYDRPVLPVREEILPGSEFTPANPNKPPVLTGPPHKYTFTPNPAVPASEFKTTKLWGQYLQVDLHLLAWFPACLDRGLGFRPAPLPGPASGCPRQPPPRPPRKSRTLR